MILRGVAFAVGLALLSATAHVTIAHAGGYGSPHAVLTIAIAIGVGVAALAIGSAWANERKALALWLAVAIFAGEAFGFMMTAERLIVGREASQAPLRAAETERAKAVQRLDRAAADLASIPASSPRLDAAMTAKASADQAAVDKAAERGCRENCRQLLQAQVDAAEREVKAARDEIAAGRASATKELEAARTALAGLTAPPSATPLADRVGVAAWIIDLLTAALGSMAANGLGCGLIAFAGHGRRREITAAVETASVAQARVHDEPTIPLQEHAKRFAFDALFPANAGEGADVIEINAAYREWCSAHRVAPLPGATFGRALADLFQSVGIPVAERDGRLVALGVKLASEPRALALR